MRPIGPGPSLDTQKNNFTTFHPAGEISTWNPKMTSFKWMEMAKQPIFLSGDSESSTWKIQL